MKASCHLDYLQLLEGSVGIVQPSGIDSVTLILILVFGGLCPCKQDYGLYYLALSKLTPMWFKQILAK